MKRMNDEELQKLLDESRHSAGNKADKLADDDAKAYQALFDALDTEPLQGLPYDFPAKVTRSIQAENKRNSELKFYILSLIIFFGVAAAIYGLFMAMMKPGARPTYLNMMLQYKWAIVLSIFSFLTIQYLDQILVKANIFRRSPK